MVGRGFPWTRLGGKAGLGRIERDRERTGMAMLMMVVVVVAVAAVVLVDGAHGKVTRAGNF